MKLSDCGSQRQVVGASGIPLKDPTTADEAIIGLYWMYRAWAENGYPVIAYKPPPLADLQEVEPTCISADPPDEIRQLLKLLFSRYEGRFVPTSEQIVEAQDIPATVLAVLNKFASEVGKSACAIRAVYGCSSRCADGTRGNLVATDCGNQCWQCSGTC